MNDMDDIIDSMKLKGIFLMPDEESAVRKLAEARTLRSALAMFDTSPFVLHNIVRTTTEQARKLVKEPPVTAGGEYRMAQEATGQSVEELQKLLSEARLKKATEQATPKPISLDELQKMLPDATKKATEFEKAPTWEPKVGDAIIVRVKRVIKGGYAQPLVVASEFAGYVNGRLGGSVKWVKKDAKGTVLESGEIPTPGVVAGDLRLPTFVVSRAMEQDIALAEKFVYFAQVVGEKPTQYPNPYRQVVVISLGQKFPA